MAGAARHLRDTQDRTRAVIASALAAEVYGLKIAKSGIEDAKHNTTRCVVLAAKPDHARATVRATLNNELLGRQLLRVGLLDSQGLGGELLSRREFGGLRCGHEAPHSLLC